MSKEYTEEIEGIQAKYRLMTRGLKRKLKADGMGLNDISTDDPEAIKKADDMMEAILDHCILNEEECDELTLGGAAKLLKIIIDSSNNVGEKAEKN